MIVEDSMQLIMWRSTASKLAKTDEAVEKSPDLPLTIHCFNANKN